MDAASIGPSPAYRQWSCLACSLAVLLLTLPAIGVSDRAVAQVSTGHEVTIKGERAKRLLLGPTGRIGDEARLMAGTLEIQGTIGGDLTAFARRIVISGTVAGKADLRAKEIVIASGARLGGELVARSPKNPEIAADATIAGPVREIETEVNIPDPKHLPRTVAWIAAMAAVVLLLGVFLLGVLAQLAVPGPLSRGAARLRTEHLSRSGARLC